MAVIKQSFFRENYMLDNRIVYAMVILKKPLNYFVLLRQIKECNERI